jgi:hypothetical protein
MLKWPDIFTVPNPDMVADGSVDPMGMQLIWTYFGQLIFKNKLTTVSTDVRNYSINLLHHYVIHRFFSERQDEVKKALARFSSYKEVYDVKGGMIIFLEDLVVYALMDQKGTVNTFGILGSHNAEERILMSKGDFSQIQIHAERTKGVLVRQIQLGVNGRYKGPFLNMGLMTKNLEYDPKEFQMVEMLFKSWPEGEQLVEYLLNCLSDLLKNENKPYPLVTLDVYKNHSALWAMYAACFGQFKPNVAWRNFWLEKLGITSGAAKAIFDEIDQLELNADAISLVIASAYKRTQEEKDKEMLRSILELEPFLSRCVHAFLLMADPGIKRLGDVKEDLDHLVNSIALENVIPLVTQNTRLQLLISCVKDQMSSGEDFGNAILNYHKKVMEDRGGIACVEMENGELKHHISQGAPKSTEVIVNGGYWYNRYYLDAVRSIQKGLKQEE